MSIIVVYVIIIVILITYNKIITKEEEKVKKILLKSSALMIAIFLSVLFIAPAVVYANDVPQEDVTIPIPEIDGVTAPVAGEVPVEVVTETEGFTGGVSWTPDNILFEEGTVYTATITLTPAGGYTLSGVGENFFIVDGATATNPANSGIVTAVFPATENSQERHKNSTNSTTPPPDPEPEPDPWERTDVGFYEKNSTGFVTLFYSRFFRRPPDQTGLDAWVAGLINGDITGADMVNGFIFSEENQALISDYTNSEFIMHLYEVLFDRAPGAANYDAWLSLMDGGMTIEDIVNSFTHSTEFEDFCNLFGIMPYSGYVSE